MEEKDIKTALNIDEGSEAASGPQTEDNAQNAQNDDIEYTFVVPAGEVYKEPDDEPDVTGSAGKSEEEPEETAGETIALAETIIASEGLPAEKAPSEEQLSAETKVVEKAEGSDNRTRYGLPLDHPEMGELAQKQEARRDYHQKKQRLFRTRFYVITTAILLLIAGGLFSISSFFTVDSIEVSGNSHYTAEEIINMGHASPGRNIFYDLNAAEIVEYLEQNPYIKSADVKRKLPSTMVIKVKEREERLAFRYDDDYLIMDEEGILLKKTRNTPKVTLIDGIIISKIKLGEKIGTEDNALMDKAIALVKAMVKGDLYFVRVDVTDDKRVKAYIYDTLVVKTDYDSLIENIENGKLHSVVRDLFDKGIERGTITFEEDGSASFMPVM